MKLAAVSAAFVAVAALAEPAAAHHSGARYDMQKQTRVEGVVTRVDWANPHVYVYVAETTSSGEAVEWEVELFPPAPMVRMGWSRDTLSPGDPIVVSGSPTRNQDARGLYPASIEAHDALLFEGRTTTSRLAASTVSPQTGSIGLVGTWETLADLELIVAFYAPEHELTSAGAAALEAYDEATMLPARECIPYASPLLMIDPDIKQITAGDGVLLIAGGFGNVERVIHLDVADHDGAERTLQGHSIGRWDGGALVIDTTHFSDHRTGNGYRGVPAGAQKHLTERLTPSADGTRLTYAFEVADPEHLAEPVVGEVEWAFRPDLEFTPPPCVPEVARRYTLD